MEHAETNRPLIVFAGGGTGGHLYPALAVAGALRRQLKGCRIVFFGTNRPIDAQILSNTRWNLIPQRLAQLSAAPWRWPGIVAAYHRAAGDCRSRFLRDRPDWVIGTGGLGCVPPVRQAARLGIATALLNPDALPGRANRHLARCVDTVFVQWPQARDAFPSSVDVEVVGCPVRAAFAHCSRDDGLQRFGLDAGKKTLLVTGASQGARTINEATIACAEFLKHQVDWQVLHLTGRGGYASVVAGYADAGYSPAVVAFTEHMADALACADLVVARGGASTLAELTALAKPSILFPYPYHKDMHQLANARCLADTERGPAARIVLDAKNVRDNAPRLQRALQEIMSDERLRKAMSDAAGALGASDAADRIARMLLETTARSGPDAGCELLEPAPQTAR